MPAFICMYLEFFHQILQSYFGNIPFTIKQLFWCPVTPARELTFLGECPRGKQSVLHPAWYCSHWHTDVWPLSTINTPLLSTTKPQDKLNILLAFRTISLLPAFHFFFSKRLHIHALLFLFILFYSSMTIIHTFQQK